MAVSIYRRANSRNKTLAVNYAGSACGMKVSVISDAAVYHCNSDSRAVESILLCRHIRFHSRRKALVIAETNLAIRRDIKNIGIALQLGKGRNWNSEGSGFNAMQLALQRCAASRHPLIVLGSGSDLELHDDVDHGVGIVTVDVPSELSAVRCRTRLLIEY